jgi:F0F1-type ATP synthase assembly protein I
MKENGSWTRAWKATAHVSGLPVSTIAGGLVGVALDRSLGGGWIFTTVFGLLGFSAGVWQLFRGLQKLSDDDPRNPPP